MYTFRIHTSGSAAVATRAATNIQTETIDWGNYVCKMMILFVFTYIYLNT